VLLVEGDPSAAPAGAQVLMQGDTPVGSLCAALAGSLAAVLVGTLPAEQEGQQAAGMQRQQLACSWKKQAAGTQKQLAVLRGTRDACQAVRPALLPGMHGQLGAQDWRQPRTGMCGCHRAAAAAALAPGGLVVLKPLHSLLGTAHHHTSSVAGLSHTLQAAAAELHRGPAALQRCVQGKNLRHKVAQAGWKHRLPAGEPRRQQRLAGARHKPTAEVAACA
jgi:hypothetical protein